MAQLHCGEGYIVNKGAVLVRAAITEYHSLGDLYNRHLFFAVVESKIKALADRVLREGPLPGLQMALLLFPHMAEKERSFLSYFFILDTNLIDEDSTLIT